MTYSVTRAVLNKVEGANHHSMVLTALRGEGMTAYPIGPTKQHKERTASSVEGRGADSLSTCPSNIKQRREDSFLSGSMIVKTRRESSLSSQ